jgi:hypothetical protein
MTPTPPLQLGGPPDDDPGARPRLDDAADAAAGSPSDRQRRLDRVSAPPGACSPVKDRLAGALVDRHPGAIHGPAPCAAA